MSNTDTCLRQPNPQGKGLVPMLADWDSVQPVAAANRSASEFLRAYCLSSLVLAADFRFKPVIGQSYYLYATATGWNLSLIAPDEWRNSRADQLLGTCRLQADMTWRVEMAQFDEGSAVASSARDFVRGFVETLTAQDDIAAYLPVYASELPYYQRMLATAMSKSLRHAMPAECHSMQTLLATDASLAGLTRDIPGGSVDN